MNVVYNSEQYSVLAYPAQQSYELVDKSGGRMLFLRGPAAQRFNDDIQRIPDEERTEEAIDAVIDEYCIGNARPIVFH